ncbi:uteroglobin [Chionomys nivalis]|uniref:uteroglobin n=1 Tax=Chionomys nivalis TaxID=269649 RepID=UPI00259A74C2|nr:uteroglobin [Chionomys nivalis]
MKITILTIAVAMLSVCSSSASSDVCPGFLQVLESLFTDPESRYKAALEFYSPGSELRDAGIQLKKLVDTLPEETRKNILKLSDKILTSPLCNQGLHF